VIGWLLDTNVVASLIAPNGAPSVAIWASAQPEDRMFLSILTIGEYHKGIDNLDPADPNRSRYTGALGALEERFAGRVLSVNDSIVRRWGSISGEMKRQTGQSPSVIDTLLAATAIEHDLVLATRNTKDVRSSGAVLFNPWEDDPGAFAIVG
jgi:predicted nucleic acid-binding protein